MFIFVGHGLVMLCFSEQFPAVNCGKLCQSRLEDAARITFGISLISRKRLCSFSQRKLCSTIGDGTIKLQLVRIASLRYAGPCPMGVVTFRVMCRPATKSEPHVPREEWLGLGNG